MDVLYGREALMFEDPARKYPHLVQALNILAHRRFDEMPQTPAPFVLFASLMAAGITFSLIGSALTAAMVLLAGTVVSLAVAAKVKKPKQPINLNAREATEVAKGMRVMLNKRRLHRDLDEGSLVLLEECSRQWMRAKASLEGSFWKGSSVPVQYQAVRVQALEALDGSMDDIMLHYRAFVPDHVENRHVMDYVDEAVEQFTFPSKRRGNFPPAAFGPVREIGEKLRQLADEAEQMAREARLDPTVEQEASPARSLDETLSGLREIRQAEEELRQNLRG